MYQLNVNGCKYCGATERSHGLRFNSAHPAGQNGYTPPDNVLRLARMRVNRFIRLDPTHAVIQSLTTAATTERPHDPNCHADPRTHWTDCDCWCHGSDNDDNDDDDDDDSVQKLRELASHPRRFTRQQRQEDKR